MSNLPLRVGGMAFGNGVLMRSPRFWAWARADGTLMDGHLYTLLDKHRWLRAPLLRSFVVFAEMISLSILIHRRNGLRRGVFLLACLGLCVVVSISLDFLMPLINSNLLLANILLEVLVLGFGLLALRQGLGKTVWRYHGAEHKAVNAYEGGADLRDTKAVMSYGRVHDRCGTNLVVIMSLLLVFCYLPVGGLAMGQLFGTIYSVLVIGVSLEFFRLLTRRPKSSVSRVLLAGGRALQRCVTTREPGSEHVELACRALRRVVELERTT